MKRSFSFVPQRSTTLLAAGSGLVGATYGLVRLAYGLFLPDIRADLDLTTSQAAFISSGGSVIYCLAAVIGFFLGRRHPRALVAAAALTASVGAAGMAASHHTAPFAAFAVVSSAGGALASPGLVGIVRRNVAADANDRSQSRVNAGTGPGLIGAGILALVLLPDWRLAWYCVSSMTILAGVVVLLLDRDRPAGTDHAGHGMPPRSWFLAHRLVVAAAFLMGAASAATWNHARALLVESGASDGVSVSAWIALGIGGTTVIATAPRTAALRPRTIWTVTTAMVAAASSTLGLAPHSTAAVLVACAVFGWGYTAGTGALIAWTSLIDERRASAGTSMLFVTLVLGQALGAAVFGILVTSAGFATAFVVAAAIAVAAMATPSLGFSRRSLRRMSRSRSLLRPTGTNAADRAAVTVTVTRREPWRSTCCSSTIAGHPHPRTTSRWTSGRPRRSRRTSSS